MRRLAPALTVLAAALVALPAHAAYHGRRCTPPRGHHIADCRTGVHGTPDLSRAAWRALYGEEVTIAAPVDTVGPNPAAGGARRWPLVDSLAQPMGVLSADETGRLQITGTDGRSYRVSRVTLRGHGCAADDTQSRTFPLVQIIVPRAEPGGTQAFLAGTALLSTPTSRAALAAFNAQRGGGTGCGPAGRERGKVRPLANPRVGATAHARLSDGQVNSVDEYDAKPPFGNVVYFTSNTTSVSVGGVARGMVRVGTPVAKVDSFARCDPNSDGTLTWRYLSVRTGVAARPRLFGWVPARCPAGRR